MTVVISTQSASDAYLLSTLIDDGLSGHDPRSTCSLYAAPRDCALDDEDAMGPANPSYVLFMNREEILAAARAALRTPAREAAFRRYTLNQRIEQADPFISPSLWESCHGPLALLSELPMLFGGIDLSSVSDLTALCLAGCTLDGQWHVHARFWLPREGLVEMAAADHAPYYVWHRQDHLY